MEEQTKEKIREFCEGNFISEGFDIKLEKFLEGEMASLDLKTKEVSKGIEISELTIKIELQEM